VMRRCGPYLRPPPVPRARSSADRAPDYESVGRGFKSLRARQIFLGFSRCCPVDVGRLAYDLPTLRGCVQGRGRLAYPRGYYTIGGVAVSRTCTVSSRAGMPDVSDLLLFTRHLATTRNDVDLEHATSEDLRAYARHITEQRMDAVTRRTPRRTHRWLSRAGRGHPRHPHGQDVDRAPRPRHD
jgi:hypothetical protein